MAQGYITSSSAIFTISPEEQMPLLKSLCTDLYRTDAFECVKDTPCVGGYMKCDCFDCQPLTMEEACIRYLAGKSVDFRFIEG